MRVAVAQPGVQLADLRFFRRRRVRLVLQSEAAECGLACLAMVAGYHRHEIDLQVLRQRFPLSIHGLTLNQLMGVAAGLQLSARALRVELSTLVSLRCPCVLHWDMNHFVVLAAIKGEWAEIFDPAQGRRKFRLSELGTHVTGVALELAPTREFTPRVERRTLALGDLWSRISGLKRSLALLLMLSLLLQLFLVVSPLYLQTVVDDVLLRSDADLLLVLALGFALLLLIEAGVSALRQLVILNFSSRLGAQLSANLFRHLVRLPLDYFQKRHLGDVVSRFGSLERIRDLLSSGLVAAFVDGLMAVITLAVMLAYSVPLTLTVLIVVALYTSIRLALLPAARRITEEGIVATAKMDTHFMESVRAIQSIKLQQRECDREGEWQNRLTDSLNRGIELSRLRIGHETANLLLFGAGNILVIYLAADSVMSAQMSLGMLYAFLSYNQRFVSAMQGLVERLVEIRMLRVHLQRLADIAFTRLDPAVSDTPVSRTVRSGTEGKFRKDGECLEVRDLAYRYGADSRPVFSSFDMQLERGECVAIVGPSGVGKSTLLKCLMGLYQPSSGEVRWNGRGISGCQHYRQAIAGVMQDDQLLSGSIADNIACFDPAVDLQRIAGCAGIACLHREVLNLPMQYNTFVGDLGTGLSGGQVQRILLARALYRQPEILYMDEATSHLDVATEKSVSANIAQLEITRVIVAHRPETIAMADRVIELGR